MKKSFLFLFLFFFLFLIIIIPVHAIQSHIPILHIESYDFFNATDQKIKSAYIGEHVRTHMHWTTFGRTGNITTNEQIFFEGNKTAVYSRWTPYFYVPDWYPGAHIYYPGWTMPNRTVTANVTAYHNHGDVQFPGYIDDERSIKLPVTICGDVDYDLNITINDVVELYYYVVDPTHELSNVDVADVAENVGININDVVELYYNVVDPTHNLSDVAGVNCKC